MPSLGLFGGSFDPIHLGHLLVAEAAREEMNLTRLYFIPAAQSPFKPDRKPTPAGERLRLMRLALAGHDWCEIDDQEIRRGGVSYTIDTARDYARRFPDARLYYLIGTDHAEQLPKWREANELARLLEFVVIPRPGQSPPEAPASLPANSADILAGKDARARRLATELADTDSTSILRHSSIVVGYNPLPVPFHGRLLRGFPLGVSSSQIRARVKAGLTIDHLVPAAVAEAIRGNNLYR
jgi:nicotinate-nucleotide adenylyltransferase